LERAGKNPFPAHPPKRRFIWADRAADANEIPCRSDELRYRDRPVFSGPEPLPLLSQDERQGRFFIILRTGERLMG